MSAKLSQADRILAVLSQRAAHGLGVTFADFDCQPAVDGLNRITRVAARIDDLRKGGHLITSEQTKLGDTTVALYKLVREKRISETSKLSVAGHVESLPSTKSRMPRPVRVASASLPATDPQLTFDDLQEAA